METKNEVVTKKCAKCKQVLPLSDYHKDKSTPLGVRCSCKECIRKSTEKARLKKEFIIEEKKMVVNKPKVDATSKELEFLKDVPSRLLAAEMRRRGYRGELVLEVITYKKVAI